MKICYFVGDNRVMKISFLVLSMSRLAFFGLIFCDAIISSEGILYRDW